MTFGPVTLLLACAVLCGSAAAALAMAWVAGRLRLDRLWAALEAGGALADARLAAHGELLTALADRAKREGVLAVAQACPPDADPALRLGVRMLLDGASSREIADRISALAGHPSTGGVLVSACRFAPGVAAALLVGAVAMFLADPDLTRGTPAMAGMLAMLGLCAGAAALTTLVQARQAGVATNAMRAAMTSLALSLIREGAPAGEVRSQLERLLAPTRERAPSRLAA